MRRSVNPAATQVGQKRGKIGVLPALGLHVPIDPPVCAAQSPSTKHTGCDGDGLDHLSFSQRHGALIKKGGYYRPGKQYASSLAEIKMATRTTRSAAATGAKKDDGNGMNRGHSTINK